MQPEKQDNAKDNSKEINESIANAEERRKKAIKENDSVSEEQLEEISGGIPIDLGHTAGYVTQ